MGAKDQKSYWKDRVRKRIYKRDGETLESSEYYAFLQWGGKRKWIPLGTGNADKAAVAAAKKYVALTEGGWAALDKKSNATADSLTVGQFLEQLENVTKVSPRTWGNYVKAFRQIVSEIKELKAPKGDKFCWEDYCLKPETVASGLVASVAALLAALQRYCCDSHSAFIPICRVDWVDCASGVVR